MRLDFVLDLPDERLEQMARQMADAQTVMMPEVDRFTQEVRQTVVRAVILRAAEKIAGKTAG